MEVPPFDDETFWPRVLVQLSQRMEEVLKLKKEVADLRRERDEHDIQARAFVEHATTLMAAQPFKDDEGVMECLKANRLLSEQLGIARIGIQTLNKQNASLEEEKKLMLEKQANIEESSKTVVLLQNEISRLSEENASELQKRDLIIQELKKNLSDAEQQLQNLRAQNQLLEQHESCAPINAFNQLEENNRLLNQELQKAREENRALRAELHKEKEIIKSTLENLQGSFRKLPQSPSLVAASKVIERLDKQPTLSVPVAVKSQPVDEDQVSFIDLSTPHNQPDYVSPIPKGRQEIFDSFTSIVVDDDFNHSAMFSRTFLMDYIGGSCQPLIVKISKSQKPLAEKLGITSYLCPNLDLNPWCPMFPGEHGYMFVGLGTEKETFVDSETHHVFVGFNGPSKHSQKLFKYMGLYNASRVNPLTVEEWNSLTEHVKSGYCATTKQRTSDSRPMQAIRADYDAGKLLVPCVLLKCIDYNEELAKTLSERVKLTKVAPLSPSKRRREDDDSIPNRKRHLP